MSVYSGAARVYVCLWCAQHLIFFLPIQFLSCGLMDGIPANMADGYPIVKDHMTRTLSSPIVTRYNDSRIKI